MERNKVVHERACLANMSCQRLSIVFNFESSDIVESVIIKLSLAKRWVSCVILDQNLLKLSSVQVNHFLLCDLHYQMSP